MHKNQQFLGRSFNSNREYYTFDISFNSFSALPFFSLVSQLHPLSLLIALLHSQDIESNSVLILK